MVRYFIGGIDVSCGLPLVSQRYFDDYAVIIRRLGGLLRSTEEICAWAPVVKPKQYGSPPKTCGDLRCAPRGPSLRYSRKGRLTAEGLNFW